MIGISQNGEGVVILGAHGTLGQQLALVFPQALSFDREDLDVTNEVAVREKLSKISNLSAVINCVAFNDVDGAEIAKEPVFLLNATVPGQLATLCKELGVVFVHYSTGYVFAGDQDSYNETDQPRAISVYAESKIKGEQAVIASGAQYYLIRTNVLFGPKGKSDVSKPSFVDIMVNLSKKTNTIKAVDDEVNSITYAPDLAVATKSLLETDQPKGIYHIVNSGYATWYGLAAEIFDDLGVPITLVPVAGTEFPRPAKRPARIVLTNNKLPALRAWQDALKEYLTSQTI